MTSSGTRQRQYTAAVVFGVLAMLRALQQAFVTAFATTFTLGSLVTFVVTMSCMSLFNIHPAFWGLVIGYAVSRVLERADHAGFKAKLTRAPLS
ncbi:benzoate/H(+) symporter BenE family transporter [Arthrobacter sp. UYEF21]